MGQIKTIVLFLVLLALPVLFRPAAILAQDEAQNGVTCASDVTVQEGEWLSTIAERELGDPLLYPAIAEATNLAAQIDDSYTAISDNDVIEPGWKLCIPSADEAQALVASPAAPAESGVLTVDELANATYSGIYEDQEVTLTDGRYEGEPFVPEGAARPTVTFDSRLIAFGDLNGDGTEDAAVLLSENSGGSGTFTYVGAVLNEDGQPGDGRTMWVGDRTQVKSMVIENGQIVVEIVTQGPDDPQCCPSLKQRKTYALQEGELVEVSSEDIGPISGEALNNTTWSLVYFNVDQEPVLDGTEITISFADGQVSGSGGCNSYTASFDTSGDFPQALSFGPAAATLAACAPPVMDQETRFFSVLENVSQWSYQIGQLALFYANDQGDSGTLIFAPQAASEGETASIERLTASPWQWVRLTDPQQQVEIASPENYTLTFLPDGSVQIKADCNNAMASYTVSEDGALAIEPGISTLAACGPESRGEELVQKLGFVGGYFFQDGNLFIDLMADGGTLEFSPQPADDQSGTTPTEVITFVPTNIPTETQSGSCFGSAIGLGREDAYRCTVGNQIYDPCFVVGANQTVVCGANPATGETGFVLELTEPLPEPETGQPAQPWLIELADGQICGLMTGTVPGVGDRIAPYGCPDGSNLFEDFQQGEVWQAEKAVIGLNDDGYFIESSEIVPVTRVWQ